MSLSSTTTGTTGTAERHAPADALRSMFSRDFIYLAVSALQAILSTGVTPILTRRVGAEAFGQFTLAATVMQIIGPLLSFGLPFAAQKVFAEKDGDRQARGVLAISVVLVAVAWVAVAVAAPLWGPAVGLNMSLDARLASLWGACFALTWTTLAMLRSKENLSTAIVVSALQSLGAQGLGLILLYAWKPTLTSYLCGVNIGQVAAMLVGVAALRPDWSALATIRRRAHAFAFGLPMVPQQLCVFILFAGDRIVVRHDLGSVATGRYSVAYNVGSLGVLLLVFLNQAWTPRIYAVADRRARAKLLGDSRDVMNLLLVPLVCGLTAGAPVVLALWAPGSFDPLALTSIVAIIAICTFPYGQFLSNLRALMSEGKTLRAALTTAIAAAVNVVLNVILVPHIGLLGSASATFFSYALLALLTRPPASAGLRVPGMPLLLGVIIMGAFGVALLMGELPVTHLWLAVRLLVSLGCVAAFALLMRRAISGFNGGSLFRRRPRGRHVRV